MKTIISSTSLASAIVALSLAAPALANTPLFKKKAEIVGAAGATACMVDTGRVTEAQGFKRLYQHIRKANLEDVADWLMSPKGSDATQLVKEHMNSTCTGVINAEALMEQLVPLML